MSNRLPTRSIGAVLLALAPSLFPGALRGQVGHDPEHSPYHDLRASHQLTLSGGFLGGGGGRAGVGPRQGPLGGLRFSISLGASLEMTAAVLGGQLDRHLLDPTAPPDTRDAGVITQSLFIFDVGFNLRITGAKTWHGFVPYAGASAGLATGGAVADNSGFAFGNPFQFGPHLGIRRYGGERLSIWVEGWDPIWRLRYPDSFYTAPAGTTPVLALDDPSRQWVHNPTLLIGFGYTLRR